MPQALTKEQALQKLRQFCAYQERSHQDVQQKLYALKVPRRDHDEIIATLIEEDYLNEQRFAEQFTGGKFRMKGWGKNKILQKLKEKNVSSFVINAAMKEIDEEDYLQNLKKDAEKKYEALKHEQHLVRKKKTINYLLQKGYEYSLISRILPSLGKDTES
ncbi:MAG: regulatory protein RecX [Flavisolibacter sp.]